MDLLRRMLVEMAQRIDKADEERHIQFKRMAQLQAELDEVRRLWAKMGGT